MQLLLVYLLFSLVWTPNALEIAPQGTFRFSNVINGSFSVEQMIGTPFLADCLQLCVKLEAFCQVIWFIEEDTRCNLFFVVPDSAPMRGNYWIRIN